MADDREHVTDDGTRAELKGLGLRSVPDWLAAFTELRVLDLSGNRLARLPEWLGHMTELAEVNVHDNDLGVMPQCLAELPKLRQLDVGRNNLTVLPDWLPRLASMEWLSVAGNKLSDRPGAVQLPSGLTYLDLAGNRLREVPESIRALAGLDFLDLEDNQLAELPAWLGELTRLRDLWLRGNRLSRLPESAAALEALEFLYAASNLFSDLPPVLRGMPRLRRLFFNRNRLAELPVWIGELGSLTHLYLGSNQLTGVPDSVGRLSALKHLVLNDNRLTDLPSSVGELPDLELIALAGNPLRSPLAEIAAEGSSAVCSFLSMVSAGAAAQWGSKLVIVGEGATGKTSLVKALTGQPHDPREPTTHGIRIGSVDLPHPDLPDVSMHLVSWDFGGQDIYHATHQFFLSDRALFVLLWNARLGWEQAKLPYWLDIIKARAPTAPVILVATQADRPADLPLADLRRRYPEIAASMTVDNVTGLGIEELRKAMAEAAAKLPLMGSRWPAAWLAGADEIRNCGLQYATPGTVHGMLARAGLTDRTGQDHLLRALHALGDILYYDDDEELQDIIIVHPQWVTSYISAILDSHDVAARDGVLTRRQVQVLWHDLDIGLRDRFLRLMEKFDLSYRIRDSEQACLIVERLSWEEPPYHDLWQQAAEAPGAQEISIRYQLSTIPPGVPTWFIAREHRFATGLQWRTGALLRHSSDPRVAGLLRSDRHSRTVDLTVRGPAPQLFFSTLQDGFESTLARYQGLEIQRLVPCTCSAAPPTCGHLYLYDDLKRRLEHTPPRLDIECPKTLQTVSVNTLLFGIAPTAGEQILARLADIDRTVTDFRAETAWAQREFLKALRSNQLMLEAQCPSLLTITPAPRKPTDLPGRRRYELQLYCEQPGAFHPLDATPYTFDRPPEWLSTIGPYLSMLLTVLKHAAPLTAPILGLAASDLAARTQNQTSLMQALIDQLPGSATPEITNASLLDITASSDIEFDSDYRAIYALLDTLDPAHHWAGLNRVRTPEDQILWLCRDHARQYQQPQLPLNPP